MAYGSAIAKSVGSFYPADAEDPNSGKFAAQLEGIGSLFDVGYAYRNNRQAQQLQRETNALRRNIAERELTMAAQTAADEQAMRERVLGRVSAFDDELKSTLASLGTMPQVNGQEIANTYRSINSDAMDKYYKTVELASSKGKADAIRRGMDRSTQYDDKTAALIEKSAGVIPAIDQASFDAALQRSQDYQNAIYNSRKKTLDEITGVMTGAIDYENNFATNNAVNQYGNAGQNFNQFATEAGSNVNDAQKELGRVLGKFQEEVAPNMGYAFNKDIRNPVDVRGSNDAAELAFLREKYPDDASAFVSSLRENK